MRKLIAMVFNYSLDGLLADEGTEFFKFCFDLIDDLADDPARLDFLQSAYAHIMGRTAYEGMAAALPANPDHPWADVLNAGRKVVSRTLRTADWANTTIAAGDTRVLEKAGFRRIGVNRDFARGRGEEIEETILRLD